jgi:Haem-dependent oxidative N-demethylase, alpha subunit-like
MGLRPLDPAEWLEVDERREAELREKSRLLAEVHDRVAVALPGSEAAGGELFDAVVEHLERRHPGTLTRLGDGSVCDRATGATGAISVRVATHPVEAAARLVQEDLCLLERREGSWILTAACVCFPSRWDLAGKLGLDLSGIHGPVPGYAEELAAPVKGFFDRLDVGRPLWRLNWTLLDTPELHLPDPASSRARFGTGTDLGERLWFRVERQTLRRITERPAVTFTIHTYVSRLRELVDSRPEAAGALASTLATVPPDTAAYKGWEGLIEPLVAWLGAWAELRR